MSYRTMPRYANSDLSEFRNLLFGYPDKKPTAAALSFGTIFHSLVLEAKLPDGLSRAMYKQLNAMHESFQRNRFAQQILEIAKVEQINLWEDEETGLPCKSLTDIWTVENELIADVKSTSARSYGEFLQSCEDYGYDRQAAFYLDGLPQAKRFVFLGVQKQAPFEVFYFEASAARGCIEGGRKKYRALLKDAKRTGFVPTSWGIKKMPHQVGLLQAA